MIREHYPKTQMDKSIAWTSWVQGVPKQITARLELIDKTTAIKFNTNYHTHRRKDPILPRREKGNGF